MIKDLTAEASVTILTTATDIFDALINPELIKQYLFGTDAASDWKVGSPITFTGNHEGHDYQDKGIVLTNEPPHTFAYSYWSSMSGMEDVPENYCTVTFTITPQQSHNVLSVTQQGFADAKAHEHSAAGWTMVLTSIKQLVEEA